MLQVGLGLVKIDSKINLVVPRQMLRVRIHLDFVIFHFFCHVAKFKVRASVSEIFECGTEHLERVHISILC